MTTHITREFGRDLAPDAIRIGIAHGTVTDFGDQSEATNEIDPAIVTRADLDYLALGDWHGLKQVSERVWYSGTPEPDRFKDNDPGKVLLVEIGGHEADPQVTPFETMQYRWVQHTTSFRGSADIATFRALVDGLDDPRHTLLRLTYDGALHMAEAEELRRVLAHTRDRLLHLRERGAGVVTMPSQGELALLELDGYLHTAVEALRAAAEVADGAEASEESRTAARALDLFYRLYQEGAK